ncbi:LON peptidase substrate-binding domain-containing protein [Labrys wisconsinensis]|uniref:Lon protease-like protein n=1 Tax=Labrys wisconsinensis TaxID=425677 RepID=A0ABU0JAF9_9HYPH|nr:LON peptidase substrate-binding domain-containing protein [Labrys wisconsinensis]MDQ0471243.1 Lon protease-like protein [Labrys wisconsinensis]
MAHAMREPGDLPAVIPVFPLAGALLLPRGHMPLNIFEPRYLAMVDDALRGPRLIGMIQPEAEDASDVPRLYHVGCVGRITSFSETGDGRYLIQLTGVARFRVLEEPVVATPYRQCRVTAEPFAVDFKPRAGEGEVDRDALIRTLRAYIDATGLQADWDAIRQAPNEALVNALSMMSPFGVREKQALLEAASLKQRADMLVAITEIELAKNGPGGDGPLQ